MAINLLRCKVEVHMEIVLNDLAVALFLRLEEEVSKTKASTKKSQQKPRWLNLRSPFDQDEEVGFQFAVTPTPKKF